MHAELHDQLVAQGHTLASRLGRLESECAHQDALHASIKSVRAASPALDRLMNDAQDELAQIETTLHRMVVGGFGRCVGCGADISERHLTAAPHTERCDACESRPGVHSLAEVSAQHIGFRRLLASIVELVEVVAADVQPMLRSTGHAGAALTLLSDLESELSRHFAAEERGGYLVEAVAAAPHLAAQAATLQAEHPGLRRAAAELAETARQAGRSKTQWGTLREQLATFSPALLRHEAEENEIIAHAWMDDEGGG